MDKKELFKKVIAYLKKSNFDIKSNGEENEKKLGNTLLGALTSVRYSIDNAEKELEKMAKGNSYNVKTIYKFFEACAETAKTAEKENILD